MGVRSNALCGDAPTHTAADRLETFHTGEDMSEQVVRWSTNSCVGCQTSISDSQFSSFKTALT
jgi:hypothetical protein